MKENDEYINKKDAVLFIDVVCITCKRRMALTNAIEYEGACYCGNHYPLRGSLEIMIEDLVSNEL